MNASRRKWAVVGLVVVAAAIPMGSRLAAGPREAATALEVRVTLGRLSVRASEAPLAEVLLAVGRAAHLKIVLPAGIQSLVTDEFLNLPIDEAVRRLTRWHSVVLVYGGPRDKATEAMLAEVWVTAAPSDGAADDKNGEARRDGFKRSSEVQAPPANSRREQGPDSRPPGLTMALRFGPSDSRVQIINALVRERGEYAVVDILREAATRDPNPRVRRGALQVLASLKTPEAVEAVQAALNDEHPGVRGEAETALRRLRQAHAAQ